MPSMSKVVLAAACAGGMFVAGQAQAANWLMLQGTEPAGASARAKVWGFIQALYEKDYSDPNPSGGYIPPKLLGPDLDSQSGFNVRRARIGVRGTGLPLDSKVNYFLLMELGNNGITHPGNAFAKVTDASITLNQIPGARVRAGLFKYPGSEESFQGIFTFDYINFTEVTNQMILERFPNSHYTPNVPAQSLPPNTSLNQFTGSIGAVRDVGVEVFDTFKQADWEHSYAVMIGNGNGLNFSDNNDKKDLYLYWSSEKVFGGKGPFRPGLKFFAWHHSGERLLDNTDDGVFNPQEFKRTRYGVGVKYLQKPWRVSAEYMKGKGMIFVGPQSPTFDQNGVPNSATGLCPNGKPGPTCAGGDGATGKASGWYVEGGWYIPSTKWELDLRYDVYHRLKGDPGPAAGPYAGDSLESDWKTLTFGVQYHVNRKTRLTVDFAHRTVKTPAWPTSPGPNVQMAGIGNRVAMQLTHVF